MNVTLEELKAEVLQNPEVRAEYERLRPEFELAETIITARLSGRFSFQAYKSRKAAVSPSSAD